MTNNTDTNPTTHTIPAHALSNPYNEQGHSSSVRTQLLLRVEGARASFGVGYVDSTGESRRVQGGPALPGPYAYAWGKAVVIDNHGGSAAEAERAAEAGLVIDAKIGDVLVMPDGERFTIAWAGSVQHPDRHNIVMVHVASDEPAEWNSYTSRTSESLAAMLTQIADKPRSFGADDRALILRAAAARLNGDRG